MKRRALLLGTVLTGSSLGVALSLRSLGARAGATTMPPFIPGPGSIYGLRSDWTNDAGASFRLSSLAGNFLVLALIFTRCPSVCPLLVHDLRAAQERMPGRVLERTHFALFSIDPEHDSVTALRAYRERMQLATAHWTLARASADAVRELAATLGFAFSADTAGLPLHSKLVTLLDPSGVPVVQSEELAANPELLTRAVDATLASAGAR
jgi:protein SCO1/2